MNKDRMKVTNPNPARTLFIVTCVISSIILIVCAVIRMYHSEYNKYLNSFRLGEAYGMAQTLVDAALWLEKITPEEYLEYEELSLELFNHYSKEKGDEVINRTNSLAGSKIPTLNLTGVIDMQAFQDGFMMQSGEIKLTIVHGYGKISDEKYEELNERREKICNKPKHRIAERYIQEVIEINKSWLEDGTVGYDKRGSEVLPLFEIEKIVIGNII